MDRKPALSGLRILGLADEKAAFCSRLLADMGAEAIKVEKPGGDTLQGGLVPSGKKFQIPRAAYLSGITIHQGAGMI